MGLISLTLRGLGMWVDRTDHWEILFPAAELRKRSFDNGSNEMLPRHDPILRIRNKDGEVTHVRDLRDRILDLTELADHEATATFKKNWMIKLKLPHDAPARSHDAIATAKEVLGGVKLPGGDLNAEELVDNVTYDGTPFSLACRLRWTTIHKAGMVKIRLRDGSEVESIRVPSAGIKLEIESLSVADAQDPGTKGTKRVSDEDFAAHYVLSAKTHEALRKVPTLPAPPAGGPAPSADPEHLCSTVYGEDDPP